MQRYINKFLKSVHPSSFVLTAVNIGGALEWYEIGLFISWPMIIKGSSNLYDQTFADSLSITAVLLMTVLALASGGARALGGWYFGKMGDKEGRKKAFSLSVLIATLPSLIVPLISFIIPYQEWISYSAIIFAAVKFFQGVPAGGEFPGAICFLAETGKYYKHLPPWVSRRYLCSYTILGPQLGLMLSMIVCLALRSLFSAEVLEHKGLQITFLSSGLLGVGGYIMRNILHETDAFKHLQSHHKVAIHPVRTIFKKYLPQIVFGFNISIFETVSFIVLSLIPLFYLGAPYALSFEAVAMMSIASTFLRSAFLILIARLLVQYKDYPWIKLSVWGMIILSLLLYATFLFEEFVASLIINIAIVFAYSIQAAILPSLLAELFPTRVRYTGIAFSFNICDAILLTVVTSLCYMLILQNSASFVLFLTISAFIFLLTTKSRLWNKSYYR